MRQATYFVLVLILSISTLRSTSQTLTEYHKFLDNTSWKCAYKIHLGPVTSYWWRSIKDTTINSKSYTIIEHDITSSLFSTTFPKRQYVREDTVARQVFYLDTAMKNDVLWYDFSLNVGDTFRFVANYNPSMIEIVLEKIDTISTIWGPRRELHFDTLFNGIGSYQWIEGAGETIGASFEGPFSVFQQSPWWHYFHHDYACNFKNSVKFYGVDPLYTVAVCESACPSISEHDSVDIIHPRICDYEEGHIVSPCDTSFYWTTLDSPAVVISVQDTLKVSPDTTTSYIWHGSIQSDTFTIVVDTSPTVNLGPDIVQCYQSQGILLNPQVSDPSVSYRWQNGWTGHNMLAKKSGTYHVKVSYSNGCTDHDTVMVKMLSLPDVTAEDSVLLDIIDPPYALTSGLPSGGSYSGPGVSGSSFDPSAAGTGLHEVLYVFTDTSGCSDTAISVFTVTSTVSVESIDPNREVRIYPNPSREDFILDMGQKIKDLKLQIYSLEGRLIWEHEYELFDRQIIPIHLPSGAYVLKYGSQELNGYLPVVRN